MDLKTSLAEPLWAAIESTYESRNYMGAIIDAMYYLGDIIREKTGLQSDGVALVGQAFGGKSPKLRVNQLQTETDLSVQKGTENLLLGLYQSIRNPRSHGKLNDTKEDADAIILFINYSLNIIGASKGTFSKSEFLNRVFDPSYVKRKRYAELLVEEIPQRYRLDVMTDVYRRKEEGDLEALALFSSALLAKLEEDDISKLAEVASEELNSTNDESTVRITTKMFPIQFWERLNEPAKLRSENRFLESIKEGEYITASKKCIKGAFGTWCQGHLGVFIMKDDCISALLLKLVSSKKTEQDYVFCYFWSVLLSTLDQMGESWLVEWAKTIINDGLKAGDKRFYELASSAISYHQGF
jgi:uncharacterized protein (TIGR02391 family)